MTDLPTALLGAVLLLAAGFFLGRAWEASRVELVWAAIEEARAELRREWGKLNYERFVLERDRVVAKEAPRGLS